ncbi:hypothetical protein Vretimale_18064, partial [Volvox reticuliferus]
DKAINPSPQSPFFHGLSGAGCKGASSAQPADSRAGGAASSNNQNGNANQQQQQQTGHATAANSSNTPPANNNNNNNNNTAQSIFHATASTAHSQAAGTTTTSCNTNGSATVKIWPAPAAQVVEAASARRRLPVCRRRCRVPSPAWPKCCLRSQGLRRQLLVISTPSVAVLAAAAAVVVVFTPAPTLRSIITIRVKVKVIAGAAVSSIFPTPAMELAAAAAAVGGIMWGAVAAAAAVAAAEVLAPRRLRPLQCFSNSYRSSSSSNSLSRICLG